MADLIVVTLIVQLFSHLLLIDRIWYWRLARSAERFSRMGSPGLLFVN